MKNVIRLALGRLGHAFDTRMVSAKELNQAHLLGDSVARHNHYAVLRDSRGFRIG